MHAINRERDKQTGRQTETDRTHSQRHKETHRQRKGDRERNRDTEYSGFYSLGRFNSNDLRDQALT